MIHLEKYDDLLVKLCNKKMMEVYHEIKVHNLNQVDTQYLIHKAYIGMLIAHMQSMSPNDVEMEHLKNITFKMINEIISRLNNDTQTQGVH